MARLWTVSINILFFLVLILVQNIAEISAQQSPLLPHYRRERLRPSQVRLNQDQSVRIYSHSYHKMTSSSSSSLSATPRLRGDQHPPRDIDEDMIQEQDIYPLTGYVPWSSATRSPFYKTVYRAHRPQQRVHPCEHSSCYPATGNLLIGRENRLYASSTCGIHRPERYCIVSHLEEKKCFLCDTRRETENDPLKNHRVGQIIYKNQPGTLEQSWWQSENGRENVTIQLDLEAEFHFTHLIIVFATFRPAAMFIERSYDFGKSWHVYRYFAHNCHESFSHAPTFSKNITDVVCDQRYSSVEPSKHGEVIFRVLPPNMNIENPYADHIQNMLKMTNLRINFTRLHTLGDTLLDDRQEIQEKYYYGISNMVVRGSCSCYGHASRCLPLDGVINKIDMVHGRCECTHNTKGLNCEECEDFFNDLPWNPALGKQTNACKKCNCNNHATSCHFDQAVYEHSGRISGGVCDNCQHNTQGQHCEECIPFFYKDPNEDIQSPYICRSCDCDPRGSLDEGICDSVSDPEYNIEAGACHCKNHVKGRRCDVCKDGYWNLDDNNPDGCQNCTCNLLGTINNSGCNMYTGECTCKRLVVGKDCNHCMPETYGLSDSRDGCSPCNCDPGGSLDNLCDVSTGQCSCRSFMTGRICNIPKQNHFIPNLHAVYEAESPEITECNSQYSYGNCSLVVREWPNDHKPSWSGPGYVRVPEGTTLTFTVTDIVRTMPYDVVIRYATQTSGDWDTATITVIRPDDYDPDGPCANSHPAYETNRRFHLPEYGSRSIVLSDVCLEEAKTYKFLIHFERHRAEEDNPSAQILIDSLVLVPRIDVTPILSGSAPADNRLYEYNRNRCNESYYDVNYDDYTAQQCKDIFHTVSIYVFDGATPCNCNPTGSMSKKCEDFGGNCQCKPNIVGRQCDKCSPGYYGFGPEGCIACDCNSIGSKDNDCDLITGQCNCHPNTYGRECDQCQPGFWNFPNCQMCECNGHTQTCDPRSGECIGCQDSTTGYNCDRCIEGFYGNPLLGSEIGCRPCRCPDTVVSGHSHATSCTLDPRTNDMVCHCKEGYSGPRCDICANNYYGHPDKPGGICQPCECNDNIDPYRPGNCDAKTGKCLQCLYDTEGDHCEYCKDGFYGDAFKQSCRQCNCDLLGTNNTIQYCDRYTGQCPCLKNVQGLNCDSCIPNHWKIAKGEGCEACDCDLVGSNSDQCNPYDGQCSCNSGFGGRQCNQCQANFWGNPNVECHECKCNRYGSATDQCNRETGQCACNVGIGGYKCDQCARGYLGQAPYCEPCGECFDNWDLILENLREETKLLIDEAKKIKTVGATGAYTKEFEAMAKKLDTIRQLLDNTTVSAQDIDDLEGEVAKLRADLNSTLEAIKKSETTLENVSSNINLANVALDDLRNRSDNIKNIAADLKRNATQLQEANIEGALNLTREAWDRVQLLNIVEKETQDLYVNAERQCKRTDSLTNRTADETLALIVSNKDTTDQYKKELDELNSKIPDLNEKMCDKRGDPCDDLCGGAGCKTCGGLSCEKGALTRADKALTYAKDTEKKLKEKEELAEDLIRSLSQAKTNASDAWKRANRVFDDAQNYKNETGEFVNVAKNYITSLTDVINNDTASPEEIEKITKETLSLKLELDPDEITSLADRIDKTVQSLENVDAIIRSTHDDLAQVEDLKIRANNAKDKAENVLTKAKDVVTALDEADAAQNKATNAIKQANENIKQAKVDLDQIDGETVDAQRKANETANIVAGLSGKLNELHKKFLKNSLDANDIKDTAEQVKESANDAHKQANQLRNNYQKANNSLTEKAETSKSAREKAQQLLQRASRITVETTGKLKELQDMTDIYKGNAKDMNDLMDKITELNAEINRYSSLILTHADRYRQCSS